MLNKVKHAGREKSVSCDSGSWFAAVIPTCCSIACRYHSGSWRFAAVIMFADITVLRQWLSLSPFLSLSSLSVLTAAVGLQL